MRKAKSAILHVAYFLKNTGTLGPTIEVGDPKYPGLEMFTSETGLYINYAKREAFVPWSNVVGCTLEPEDKPAPTPKPKT